MKSKLNKSENIVSLHNDEQDNNMPYNSIKRRELLLWMSDSSENVLCEVMKRINPAPYKKLMGPDMARLHALLAAANEIRSALGITGRKNPERNLGRLEESHRLNLALSWRPKRRRSPKREKLTLHEGVIRQLLAEGCSLRQVAAYLQQEVKIKITHTYLRKCCLEMGIDMFCRVGSEGGGGVCAG